MQIAVGQILRAHGIRGEVLVVVRTDEPGVRFAPGSVLPTEPPERGPLTVASVLGNLYPLVTIVLGVLILKERVHRWHALGIVLALAGVTMIAAG